VLTAVSATVAEVSLAAPVDPRANLKVTLSAAPDGPVAYVKVSDVQPPASGGAGRTVSLAFTSLTGDAKRFLDIFIGGLEGSEGPHPEPGRPIQ
jgi:hypothetical protein